MIPESLHDAMHTFCHVKIERSFDFGIDEAWLCHRCSGIYGGFLYFSLLALATKWNGLWSDSSSPKQRWWSAAIMMALCGLQVALQEWGISGGAYQGWLRFVMGLLVGLALLQVLLVQAPWGASGRSRGFVFCLPLLLVHAWLSSFSYTYHTVSDLGGLLLLYVAINVMLVKDWMKTASALVKVGAALLLIPLEWSFLYYMNVGRHV